MSDCDSTKWDHALVFIFFALLFATQSCKYLTTRYPEESKMTNILRLIILKYKKYGQINPHSEKLDTLQSATIIIIIYEF